jgi:hypothetical protein
MIFTCALCVNYVVICCTNFKTIYWLLSVSKMVETHSLPYHKIERKHSDCGNPTACCFQTSINALLATIKAKIQCDTFPAPS